MIFPALRNLWCAIVLLAVVVAQVEGGSRELLVTSSPTSSPTDSPTVSPTLSPSAAPTTSPTESPTESPTDAPTVSPTLSPSTTPTTSPTESPTESPTDAPTVSPTLSPSAAPTTTPTESPTRHPPPPPSPPPSPPPGITPKVKKVKSVYQSGECCQWYKTCQPKNIKYSCYESDITHCESIGKDAWDAKCKACSMCVREDSLSTLKVNMLITTSSGDPTSNYPREACIPASGSQVWSRKLLASSVVTEQEAEVETDWPFVKAKRGALTYRVCSNVHFSCIKYMNSAGQCAAFAGTSATNFDKIAKRWCFWCKQDPGGVAFR